MKLLSAFDSLQTALVKQIYIEKKLLFCGGLLYFKTWFLWALEQNSCILVSSLEHCTGVA